MKNRLAKRRRLSACSSSSIAHQPEKKTSGWLDPTDDILFEILLRLPVKSLHRSKCISRRWLSFISGPFFTRTYILGHRNSNNTTMLVFKVQGSLSYGIPKYYALGPRHLEDRSLFPLSIFDFIPPLKPGNYNYGSGRCPSSVTQRLLVDMSLHAVCPGSGFILLQGTFQDRTHFTRYYDNSGYYYYYVCNPANKQWTELPLIPTKDLIGFTCHYPNRLQQRIWAHSADNIIDDISDYDPNKIEFTVVSINRDEHDDVFIIRVFSSADQIAGWRLFRVPFPPCYAWIDLIPKMKVLFFNGKFHWCGETGIVVYDVFDKPLKCDFIPFPPMDSLETHLCRLKFFEEWEGRLRFGSLTTMDRFVAWELVDYANKLWVKKFDVNNINDARGLNFHSFAAGDKAYVTSGCTTIRLLDLKNGSQQDVYEYGFKLDIGGYLNNLQPIMSSPWPTPVPLRERYQ